MNNYAKAKGLKVSLVNFNDLNLKWMDKKAVIGDGKVWVDLNDLPWGTLKISYKNGVMTYLERPSGTIVLERGGIGINGNYPTSRLVDKDIHPRMIVSFEGYKPNSQYKFDKDGVISFSGGGTVVVNDNRFFRHDYDFSPFDVYVNQKNTLYDSTVKLNGENFLLSNAVFDIGNTKIETPNEKGLVTEVDFGKQPDLEQYISIISIEYGSDIGTYTMKTNYDMAIVGKDIKVTTSLPVSNLYGKGENLEWNFVDSLDKYKSEYSVRFNQEKVMVSRTGLNGFAGIFFMGSNAMPNGIGIRNGLDPGNYYKISLFEDIKQGSIFSPVVDARIKKLKESGNTNGINLKIR